MKENILHLMEKDNDGKPLTRVNSTFLRSLMEKFGGYTMTRESGAWLDTKTGKIYNDKVLRLIVSFSPSKNNIRMFEALATTYKSMAKQEAVYCVVNGKVKFV